MAEQEFLASFGVEIDESGLNRLQQALQQNRELAEKLAAAFDQARASVEAFFRDLSEISLPNLGNMPGRVTEEQQGIALPFSLDFTKASKELAAFFREAGKAFRLNADGSGIVSAGRSALSQLQTLFSSTVLPLQVEVQETNVPGNSGNTGSGGNGTTVSTATGATPLQHAATGGRFDEPTKTEIAEDGDPEYVIPVKKESLAVPLLRQLTGELSDEARETLQEDLSDQTGTQDTARPERLDALSGSTEAEPLQEHFIPLSGSSAVESAYFPERRDALSGSVPAGENILYPRADAMPGSPAAEQIGLPERLDALSGNPAKESTSLPERLDALSGSPVAAEPAPQERTDNQSGRSDIGMLNLLERMDPLTGSPDVGNSASHHHLDALSGHPDPGTPALLDRADSLSGSSAAESPGSPNRTDSLSGSPDLSSFPDRADALRGSPDAAPDTFTADLLTGSPAVSNYPQAESLTGSPDVPMAGSSAQKDLLSGTSAQSVISRLASPDPSSSFINLLVSARNTLQQLFSGLQEHAGTLSGLPDLLASANAAAAPVVNNNSSNSVQAPVSIEVHAAGSDPEAVGRSIYDVTEQYLLRTLSSAMG